MNPRRLVIGHTAIAVGLFIIGVWHVSVQNNLGAFGFALMLVGSLIIGAKSYKLAIANAKRKESQESLGGHQLINPPQSAPDLDELRRFKMLALIGTDMGVQEPVDELADYLAKHYPAHLEEIMDKRSGRWCIKTVDTGEGSVVTYTRPQ